jgi:AraC-like DNA-binding protein
VKATFEKVALRSDESFRLMEVARHRFGGGWHFHPEVELTLIVQSRGIRFIGDRASRFEAGDLVLVGPNLPHCWISDDGEEARRARAIVLQFHPEFLGEKFFSTPELASIGRLLDRAALGLEVQGKTKKQLAQRLLELPRLSGARRLIAILSILEALAASRDTRALATPNFRPRLDVRASERIDQVYRFLLKHFQEPIRLAEVARIARMAPSAFCRNFRRDVGRPLFSVLNEIRIGHACKLLSETGAQVSEICYGSGFGNLSHFNRQFLRVTGFTPREYRKKLTRSATAATLSS